MRVGCTRPLTLHLDFSSLKNIYLEQSWGQTPKISSNVSLERYNLKSLLMSKAKKRQVRGTWSPEEVYILFFHHDRD